MNISFLFCFQRWFWRGRFLPALQRDCVRSLHRKQEYLCRLAADAGRDWDPNHR